MIRDYVALLDPAQLGLNLNVFIFISLKAQNRSFLSDFEDRICAHESDGVLPDDRRADYLIRVAMPDITSLERFIVDVLSYAFRWKKSVSSFALKQVRYKTLRCRFRRDLGAG